MHNTAHFNRENDLLVATQKFTDIKLNYFSVISYFYTIFNIEKDIILFISFYLKKNDNNIILAVYYTYSQNSSIYIYI